MGEKIQRLGLFEKKCRNCDANLLKNWTFENLWNHFEVLLHKVFPEFMILPFHDFLVDPKITKFPVRWHNVLYCHRVWSVFWPFIQIVFNILWLCWWREVKKNWHFPPLDSGGGAMGGAKKKTHPVVKFLFSFYHSLFSSFFWLHYYHYQSYR